MTKENNSTELVDRKLRNIVKEIVNNTKFNMMIEQENNFNFIKDLEFDSVKVMQLIFSVEEKFNVKIMEEENIIDIVKNFISLREWLCGKEY